MEKSKKSKIVSFTDLYAWQEGHKLVLSIYLVTKEFPTDERFGLTSQMRRCGVSITSNIAEGFGRPTSNEKMRFYHIAIGSLIELQNQLLISRDVGILSNSDFTKNAKQTVTVQKLTNGLIRSIKNNN